VSVACCGSLRRREPHVVLRGEATVSRYCGKAVVTWGGEGDERQGSAPRRPTLSNKTYEMQNGRAELALEPLPSRLGLHGLWGGLVYSLKHV
jgi:hypothetical protein